jgi:hypothetical protein
MRKQALGYVKMKLQAIDRLVRMERRPDRKRMTEDKHSWSEKKKKKQRVGWWQDDRKKEVEGLSNRSER